MTEPAGNSVARRPGSRRSLVLAGLMTIVVVSTAISFHRLRSAPAIGLTAAAPTPAPPKISLTQAAVKQRPGQHNTGVPPQISLRTSKSLTVTERGTVIDGLDIIGCVDIKADDVVIRRSRITCDRPTTAVRQWGDSRGLVVEDVEIDGSGIVSAAVGFSSYTLRRVNIHNVIDGPRMSNDTLIEQSWIHNLARRDGSHNDAIQTTGGRNLVIRGNSLEVYNAESGDFFNAAVMVGSTTAPEVRHMLVEGNYFDGGNYTINFRKDLAAAEIVFRANRFGRNMRYGPVAGGSHAGVAIDATNVWDDTGRPISDGSHKKPKPATG